jgi:hypothetical protein
MGRHTSTSGLVSAKSEKSEKTQAARSHDSKKIKKQSWNVDDNKSLLFWNRPKAGMYMKASKLSAKAGMLLMPSEIRYVEESEV